jgi:hypothetical protein
MRGMLPFKKASSLFVFPLVVFLLAFAPKTLRDSDPISSALYHSEDFLGRSSIVPNPPAKVRENLLALIQSDPSNIPALKVLSDIDIQLLELDSAESRMKEYVEKSSDKNEAYTDLRNFYNSRLRFQDALSAMEQQAQTLTPENSDIRLKKVSYWTHSKTIFRNRKQPI